MQIDSFLKGVECFQVRVYYPPNILPEAAIERCSTKYFFCACGKKS